MPPEVLWEILTRMRMPFIEKFDFALIQINFLADFQLENAQLQD